ncbi:MAG: hypothetical protein Q9190_002302 [Brigantiaea leucoxantha]
MRAHWTFSIKIYEREVITIEPERLDIVRFTYDQKHAKLVNADRLATSSSNRSHDKARLGQDKVHTDPTNRIRHSYRIPHIRSLSLRMSSIENDHERETAEPSAEHTGVDGSVGSDTESGRPSNSDSANRDASDGQHHARSNSIRRPPTFKAVSVTKNFLAKAGTTTSPTVKGASENVRQWPAGLGSQSVQFSIQEWEFLRPRPTASLE